MTKARADEPELLASPDSWFGQEPAGVDLEALTEPGERGQRGVAGAAFETLVQADAHVALVRRLLLRPNTTFSETTDVRRQAAAKLREGFALVLALSVLAAPSWHDRVTVRGT